MNEIIESLKAGSNRCGYGSTMMDSHESFEYLHREPSGEAVYDSPCRWIISGDGNGYLVRQYDLSLFVEEMIDLVWGGQSDIEIKERELFSAVMIIVGCNITSKGAYNIYLQGYDNPDIIVNLLIVDDHIEKIQVINQHYDSQTIYKSSLDKISYMELEDKLAIYQVAYQMMASASIKRTVGPEDDPSIDELIRSTSYTQILGNIIWNQIEMIDPWEAFRAVSQMDDSTKAAIMQILLNVARVDNICTRLNIYVTLCSQTQCCLPFTAKRMPEWSSHSFVRKEFFYLPQRLKNQSDIQWG